MVSTDPKRRDSLFAGASQTLISDPDILLMVAVQSRMMLPIDSQASLPLPLSLSGVYLTGCDKVIYGGINRACSHRKRPPSKCHFLTAKGAIKIFSRQGAKWESCDVLYHA